MKDFNKIVRIGASKTYGGRGYSVFCRIKFANGRLSITGVEGPLPSGDCLGSCGQINMHDWRIKGYAPGWSAEMEKTFRAAWRNWHLNDMKADTPKQELALNTAEGKADYEAYKADKTRWNGSYPSHYVWACEYLTKQGLNPDDGHAYGSAWLKAEVPDDALAFLQGLPDADKTPAWV